VQEAFEDCRRKPLGKHAAPEQCRRHAEALIECTAEVKKVPALCESQFAAVTKCLDSAKSPKGRRAEPCDELLEAYLKCDHPAKKLYAGYK
jgi:hypothetical protein